MQRYSCFITSFWIDFAGDWASCQLVRLCYLNFSLTTFEQDKICETEWGTDIQHHVHHEVKLIFSALQICATNLCTYLKQFLRKEIDSCRNFTTISLFWLVNWNQFRKLKGRRKSTSNLLSQSFSRYRNYVSCSLRGYFETVTTIYC